MAQESADRGDRVIMKFSALCSLVSGFSMTRCTDDPVPDFFQLFPNSRAFAQIRG